MSSGLLQSDKYRQLFPETKIDKYGWICNTELIEYADKGGSFRNTTVEGQINGRELHLGIVDDPLKGRAEAESELIRNKSWNWFADDFLSRFNQDGAMLILLTRWHVDDLVGRYAEREPNAENYCLSCYRNTRRAISQEGRGVISRMEAIGFS